MVYAALLVSAIPPEFASDNNANIFLVRLYQSVFHNVSEKRVLILPVYVLGLANRLRTISSAYALARKLQRKLVVLWFPSSDCNSYSSDLFDVHNETYCVIIDCHHTLLDIVDIESVVISYISELMSIRLNDKELIPLTSTEMNCNEFDDLRSEFYNNVQPSVVVNEVLRLYTNQIDLTYTYVGLHARVYSDKYDWPMVPPVLGSNDIHYVPIHHTCSNSNYAMDNSTLSAPLPLISALNFQDIATEADYVYAVGQLLRNEGVRVIVVSNSLQLKAQLKEIFDFKVVTVVGLITEWWDDNSLMSRDQTLSVQVAMADFMVLSQPFITSILHTKGSSFATEASVRHGVQVLDMIRRRDGMGVNFIDQGWDRTSHTCTLRQEYMKSGKQENTRVCYVEGSGGRCVCTVLVAYIPCVSSGVSYPVAPVYCVLESDVHPRDYLVEEEGMLWVYAETTGNSL